MVRADAGFYIRVTHFVDQVSVDRLIWAAEPEYQCHWFNNRWSVADLLLLKKLIFRGAMNPHKEGVEAGIYGRGCAFSRKGSLRSSTCQDSAPLWGTNPLVISKASENMTLEPVNICKENSIVWVKKCADDRQPILCCFERGLSAADAMRLNPPIDNLAMWLHISVELFFF